MQLDHSLFYSLDHYEYGEAYYGSHQSLYYRLGIEPLENVHWRSGSRTRCAPMSGTALIPFTTRKRRSVSEIFPTARRGSKRPLLGSKNSVRTQNRSDFKSERFFCLSYVLFVSHRRERA